MTHNYFFIGGSRDGKEYPVGPSQNTVYCIVPTGSDMPNYIDNVAPTQSLKTETYRKRCWSITDKLRGTRYYTIFVLEGTKNEEIHNRLVRDVTPGSTYREL